MTKMVARLSIPDTTPTKGSPHSPEFSPKDREDLISLLRKDKPMFNSFLLYDAKGSALYEKITATPEYYIGRAELELIHTHLDSVSVWAKDCRHVLVELGSGVGAKTHELLPTFAAAAPKGFLYAPIDCDKWALEENKSRLAKLHPDIECQPQLGLFEDALPGALALEGRKTILFQGSTFGNFKTHEAATDFLRLVGSLMGNGDRLILGVDTAPIPSKKSEDFVHDCYRKSTGGHREEFMLNGLEHARRRCSLDFNRSQWKRVTEYDAEQMCVFHYYEALEDLTVSTLPEKTCVRSFKKGERILVQTHFKYTLDKIASLARKAGLAMTRTYTAASENFLWAEMTLGTPSPRSRKPDEQKSPDRARCGEQPPKRVKTQAEVDRAALLKDRATVVSMLQQNKFHTMFFYDAKGSQLYENITQQPEYYLTKTELALIEDKASEIAPWGTTRHIMVELGAGVGSKTHRLLPHMKRGSPNGNFLYAPIDCDGWCLEQNRDRLAQLHPDIECQIQVGFYEERLKAIKDMPGQKTILFLGSTICNFNSDADSIAFVKMVADCMKPGDRFIIGVDTPPIPGKKSEDFVHDAYRKSTGGHREEFIMNGLDHCNRRAGVDFDRSKWKRVTEWNAKESAVLHFIESRVDQDVHLVPEGDVIASFKKGDRVLASTHGKYSPEKLRRIVAAAGLKAARAWMPENEHWLWLESVV